MKKDFDAVQLQRDIREKLGKEYAKDPKLRAKRLAAIRKKYGLTVADKPKQYDIR
jgi:hypothetical protein